MMRSFVRNWLDRWTSPRRSPRPRPKARLQVETLEKRDAPAISINNVTVAEGNTGTVNAVLTVSLDAPVDTPVTVNFSTADQGAKALLVQRVGTYARPVFVTQAPGDNDRLFVVEQHTGNIRIYKNSTGTINATPFVTIPGLPTGNEQGLLGLAFHPNYQTNGFFYVNFTASGGTFGAGVTNIRRYQVSANPDIANAGSATTVLTFNQPQTNHNGGWLGFGGDGFLYIATGDGGGAGDTGTGHTPGIGNGQDRSDGNFLGKILRIDVNVPGAGYAIPPSNPFAGADGFEDAIWAWGLRNPWRPAFDRLTGDFYIADVGQNIHEEINVQPAGSTGGENYEWRLREGIAAFSGGARPPGGIDPIYDYIHGGGVTQGNSIAGGYVYRGPIRELQGMYFFGDSINTRIWSLRWDNQVPADPTPGGTQFTDFRSWLTTSINLLPTDVGAIANISSFGEDNEGNLYVVSLFSGATGAVHRIGNGGDYLPTSGVLTFNPGGPLTQTITVQVLGDLLDEANEPFVVNLSNATGDTIADGQGTITINDNDGLTTLQVIASEFRPTGFTADFNWPIDPRTLNIYDNQAGTQGPTDTTFTGPGGSIRGSVVLEEGNTRLRFVATDGTLANGVYTALLRSSATNGVRALANGQALDGDGDGTPGGNWTSTGPFSAPGSAIAVSIPNFTRGPGQVVDVAPGGAAGIPLLLPDTAGITSVQLDLAFDPRLLNIAGASVAPGIAGATVSFLLVRPGLARINYQNPSGLPSGQREFVRLSANVPLTAASLYTTAHALDIINPFINGGVVNGLDDDGIHVNAYFGDASANGRYSSFDALLIQRLVVGLGTGIDNYLQVDPVIPFDVTGNGMISSTDATRVLQEAVGIDRPEIPNLPPGPPLVAVSGPDPLLNLPLTTTIPGMVVTIPVNLDLSDDLQSVDLALAYDTTRLELRSISDIERGSLTGDFDLFLANHDPVAGTIRVGMGRTAGGVTGRGAGSVLLITFKVKDNAPGGDAIVNLLNNLNPTTTLLNEGALVLNPAPQNKAGDELDGIIRVINNTPVPPVPPVLPKVDSVVVNDGSNQRSRISSVTVTFSTVVTFLKDPAQVFLLKGPRGAVGVNVALSTDPTGQRTVARLTFTGSSNIRGSLINGRYRLDIDGNFIADSAGRRVDADGNGQQGGVGSVAFFRLFGDSDGDGDVDRTDVNVLLDALRQRVSNTPVNLFLFDLDNNGRITSYDLSQLRRQVGKKIR